MVGGNLFCHSHPEAAGIGEDVRLMDEGELAAALGRELGRVPDTALDACSGVQGLFGRGLEGGAAVHDAPAPAYSPSVFSLTTTKSRSSAPAASTPGRCLA